MPFLFIIDLRQEAYDFAGVYLFVCLSVSLLVALQKNYWTNFLEIFTNDRGSPKDVPINFWSRSERKPPPSLNKQKNYRTVSSFTEKLLD